MTLEDVIAALTSEWEATKQPVKQRASVLPFATYDDGTAHLAVPAVIASIFEGAGKGAAMSGHDVMADPMMAIPAAVDVAGGAMTGGFAASAAGSAPRGALMANGIGKPRGVDPATLVGAQQEAIYTGLADIKTGQPARVKGYHATTANFDSFDPSFIGKNSGETAGFAFSSDPDHAGSYIPPSYRDNPAIIPADIDFKNPFVHDANGNLWRQLNGPPTKPNPLWAERAELEKSLVDGGMSYFDAAIEARRILGNPDGPRFFDTGVDGFSIHDLGRKAQSQGHDGLIVKNVIDRGDVGNTPGNTFIALSPGTVRSATTGELLYSNSNPSTALALELAKYAGGKE